MDMNGIGTNMNNNSNEFGHWSKYSEDILKHKYPLHRACRDGDMESLSILLVSGQQNVLLEDDFYGWTPAHWAAYFGKLGCLRRIMQVLSVEPMTSRYQQTPAHLTAYAGHPHCLLWLLRTGSDLHQLDYLGETPSHKAARTGSMECISLLAAERADLNIASNCGTTPAMIAAKCGYVDCALYLQRAAEQQELKKSGVISEVVLPPVQTQAVLPGQRPDKCVITQGINGGRLPNSIESCVPQSHQPQSMEMETNGFGDGHMDHGSLPNGHSPDENGFHRNGHHVENGFGDTNGFSRSCTTPQKDVLMSLDVSFNRAPVGGRKRGREELDEEPEEWKRVRRLEMGDGSEMTASEPRFVNHVAPVSTSIDDYRNAVIAEQGYNAVLYETMLLEYHGA